MQCNQTEQRCALSELYEEHSFSLLLLPPDGARDCDLGIQTQSEGKYNPSGIKDNFLWPPVITIISFLEIKHKLSLFAHQMFIILNHTVWDTECNVRGTGIKHGFSSLGVLSVDGEACSEGRAQNQTSKCTIKCRIVKT